MFWINANDPIEEPSIIEIWAELSAFNLNYTAWADYPKTSRERDWRWRSEWYAFNLTIFHKNKSEAAYDLDIGGDYDFCDH